MNRQPGMALTGIGVVSPAGQAKNDFFRYIRGAGLPAGLPAHMAETAPGQLLKRLNITDPKLKIARYMDPVSKNAIIALKAAMSDAGLEEGDLAAAPHEYGIVLGANRGACETRRGLHDSLKAKQGRMVSATIFSHCGYNIAGAMAAIAFGIKGPNLTIAGQGDLGVSLLRVARQLMLSSRAHTVFAGFTECDDLPRPEIGPFGEVAYVLCLERKDRAVERGAAMFVEVDLRDLSALPADASASESEAAFGLASRNALLADHVDRFPFPLSGMKAAAQRYASLIKIGLLSHDHSLEARFPEVAFTTAAGKLRTEVRLRYTEEGVLA